MSYRLIIGNKNYSSWSLRPWLLLRHMAIDFEEIRIPLFEKNSDVRIREHSAAGKVPILMDGDFAVWDSLAICEYIADQHPHCWPHDLKARALARCVSAEMHSGFFQVRECLPMNCRLLESTATLSGVHSTALMSEIQRIDEIWHSMRSKHQQQGEFLFGAFSIADCMFAPVAIRFKGYGIQVSSAAQQYMDTLLALDAVQQWISEGCAETERIERAEIEL